MAITWLIILLVTLGAANPYGQQSGSTIPTPKIFEAIGIREGATVCEMGAGDGELSLVAGSIASALKPGGRLAVVDFTPSSGEFMVVVAKPKG